jgi:hypothetical protein
VVPPSEPTTSEADHRHHEVLAIGDDLLDLVVGIGIEGVEEIGDPFAYPLGALVGLVSDRRGRCFRSGTAVHRAPRKARRKTHGRLWPRAATMYFDFPLGHPTSIPLGELSSLRPAPFVVSAVAD